VISVESDAVVIAVRDESQELPALTEPRPGDEHGRGLMTLDALAADWGVKADASGKSVWFCLMPHQRAPLGTRTS
jgi:hypothetical protein